MADVATLRARLGLPPAPLVLAGLEIASDFFHTVLREDPLRWVDYLRGIDFHRPVRVELLPTGTALSQHKHVGSARQKPFVYFTVPGTSPTSTGTSFTAAQFKLFRTSRPTKALVSSASPISFNDPRSGTMDAVSRMGGGKQLIVAAWEVPELQRTGQR